MAIPYLSGILDIANVFISFFVLIYAWSFLRQTHDVRDRRPWVFLFIATIIFFVFEIIGAMNVFDISQIPELRSFLETVFIALVLFVFIFQYDLILKSDLILITRKLAQDEEELNKSVPAGKKSQNRKYAKKKKTAKKKTSKKKPRKTAKKPSSRKRR